MTGKSSPINNARARVVGVSSSGGRFMRIGDVMLTTGLGRSTIYRMVAARTFPAQIQISAQNVGWWQADVDAWLAARCAQGARAA